MDWPEEADFTLVMKHMAVLLMFFFLSVLESCSCCCGVACWLLWIDSFRSSLAATLLSSDVDKEGGMALILWTAEVVSWLLGLNSFV